MFSFYHADIWKQNNLAYLNMIHWCGKSEIFFFLLSLQSLTNIKFEVNRLCILKKHFIENKGLKSQNRYRDLIILLSAFIHFCLGLPCKNIFSRLDILNFILFKTTSIKNKAHINHPTGRTITFSRPADS